MIIIDCASDLVPEKLSVPFLSLEDLGAAEDMVADFNEAFPLDTGQHYETSCRGSKLPSSPHLYYFPSRIFQIPQVDSDLSSHIL